MIRTSLPLWIGAVCLVAVCAQVQAVVPATAAAIAPTVVDCENPTDLPRVPGSNSEAALLSEMQAWWSQQEVISQMEAWWRERAEQNVATGSTTAPPTASETIAHMGEWWRQQEELRNAMRKPVLPAQHRRHKGYADHETEFVGPNDRRVSGPTRSMLRDDELSAIRGMPQR
jgi:hypothetical protein